MIGLNIIIMDFVEATPDLLENFGDCFVFQPYDSDHIYETVEPEIIIFHSLEKCLDYATQIACEVGYTAPIKWNILPEHVMIYESTCTDVDFDFDHYTLGVEPHSDEDFEICEINQLSIHICNGDSSFLESFGQDKRYLSYVDGKVLVTTLPTTEDEDVKSENCFIFYKFELNDRPTIQIFNSFEKVLEYANRVIRVFGYEKPIKWEVLSILDEKHGCENYRLIDRGFKDEYEDLTIYIHICRGDLSFWKSIQSDKSYISYVEGKVEVLPKE